MKTSLLATACFALLAAPATAADPTVARIVDEGLNRSEIMLNGHELLDRIGPRLSNSPGMRRAETWAMDKFRSYGMDSVRKEGFEFGRGWEMVDIEVDMLTPRPIELTAIAMAWTPGTNGPLEAEIIVAPIRGPEDFDAYRGTLNGKIVMVSLPGTGDTPTNPAFQRHSGQQLADMDAYSFPKYDPDTEDFRIWREANPRAIDAFLASEGALAVVTKSYRDNKIVHGSAYRHRVGDTASLPHIEIAAEDYRRLARFAKMGDAPKLRIDSRVRFYDDDTKAYNILADIEGSDPNAGYIMAGAHYDSWAAADGAADNGSGTLVVMEAARILKELGLKPKRTIRFALWAAEEQGLQGSWAYVDSHLAERVTPAGVEGTEMRSLWAKTYPIRKRAGYDDLKAYFNMDNGSGRVRGIYAENNLGAIGLLSQWMGAFRGLDAHRVVTRETSGTDHVYMQGIGLPAFQFIQDPLDYGARLHHSNLDTLDHLQAEDLRQAAVVMAGVLWQAANSDETLPTEPLPKQPLVTDPFAYSYPEDE